MRVYGDLMIAIKAHFDGRTVVLPEEMQSVPPGEVILVFEDAQEAALEANDWTKLQEAALSKVWDNDEDAAYDSL